MTVEHRSSVARSHPFPGRNDHRHPANRGSAFQAVGSQPAGDGDERSCEYRRNRVVRTDVEVQGCEPQVLFLHRLQAIKGFAADVFNPGAADDQSGFPGVAKPVGQVDVFVPKEEPVVEATAGIPGGPADKEAGPRWLFYTGYLARIRGVDRFASEAADDRSCKQRQRSREVVVVVIAPVCEYRSDHSRIGGLVADTNQLGQGVPLRQQVGVTHGQIRVAAIRRAKIGRASEPCVPGRLDQFEQALAGIPEDGLLFR